MGVFFLLCFSCNTTACNDCARTSTAKIMDMGIQVTALALGGSIPSAASKLAHDRNQQLAPRNDRETAAHELGHSPARDIVQSPSSTMFPRSTASERALHSLRLFSPPFFDVGIEGSLAKPWSPGRHTLSPTTQRNLRDIRQCMVCPECLCHLCVYVLNDPSSLAFRRHCRRTVRTR